MSLSQEYSLSHNIPGERVTHYGIFRELYVPVAGILAISQHIR